MTTANLRRTSKFLSLVLRHQPDLIELDLDAHGWADIDELVIKANANGHHALTRDTIEAVVATSDKQRFALSEDGSKIRANQGHSINIDLELAPVVPPDRLFHGTATRFVDSILANGLTKQSRQHVHLSPEKTTASQVGTRHGKLAMLQIDAAAMHADGHQFFVSANGVWLTESVPAEFVTVL